MKIAYIASHLYRHTFEINEAAELLRQHPEMRVYSFYRGQGHLQQRRRIRELRFEISDWSYGSIIRSLFYLKVHHPVGLARSAFWLLVRSLPNPVYWVKNVAVFFRALPILADAQRHGVTHLHANFGSSPATVAWLGKKMLRLNMSVTYHAFDIYSTEPAHRDPLKRVKLRDADLIVSVHEDGRDVLRRLVPEEPASKFKVIHICVAFDPVEKPTELPEPPIVLAVGNLVPKKGFDVLVDAVGRLKRAGVSVRLRILGEGPQRPRLEQMIREQNLRDRVEMPGYFEHHELAQHLAETSVFVMPSKIMPGGQRDGIPTVVVEAWLARTAVVASLVGGMGEVIENESTGLVFPCGNAEALADAIVRLIESEALRKQLSEEGCRVAGDLFSSQRNVRELLERICELDVDVDSRGSQHGD